MTEQLHQLSLSYSAEEDRLLLLIATEQQDEYRIWLSRRFTGMLLEVIKQIIDDFGGLQDLGVSEAVQSMFKSGVFDEPQQENTGSLPFGEDGILAYGIKTEQLNHTQYAIELFSKDQKKISFSFDKANIIMLQNLLMQSLLKTDWKIADTIPGDQVVH